MTTYADVASGILDDQGNRRSVFLPVADGTPRLLAVLLARHTELGGGETPGVRGMPLGLPALSAEQIQLMESWIAQGRPQWNLKELNPLHVLAFRTEASGWALGRIRCRRERCVTTETCMLGRRFSSL